MKTGSVRRTRTQIEKATAYHRLMLEGELIGLNSGLTLRVADLVHDLCLKKLRGEDFGSRLEELKAKYLATISDIASSLPHHAKTYFDTVRRVAYRETDSRS